MMVWLTISLTPFEGWWVLREDHRLDWHDHDAFTMTVQDDGYSFRRVGFNILWWRGEAWNKVLTKSRQCPWPSLGKVSVVYFSKVGCNLREANRGRLLSNEKGRNVVLPQYPSISFCDWLTDVDMERLWAWKEKPPFMPCTQKISAKISLPSLQFMIWI